MGFSIVTYEDALVDQAVDLFNRETESAEFVAHLTPDIFQQQIVSKSVFSAQGCFLAMHGDSVIGFALTCAGRSRKADVPGPTLGVIDGLFFPADRLDVGAALLDRCIDHLRRQGAKQLCGFASFGGYPFWRGLYGGAEPVCLTSYHQAWITFMAAGFEHHQQSVNYLGNVCDLDYRRDLTYSLRDLRDPGPWSDDSWKGLHPQMLEAWQDDQCLGHLLWADMPHLSETRGRRIAGIAGLGVQEHARRQGVACSLMAYLYQIAGDAGIQQILVGTTVENIAARRTYEKVGMTVAAFRTGTRRIPA